jgi:hypothetical protein
VIEAAESFADHIKDQDTKIVSVFEVHQHAKSDKSDLAIARSLEFRAENTDLLFTHAAFVFDGKLGCTPSMVPPRHQSSLIWNLLR